MAPPRKPSTRTAPSSTSSTKTSASSSPTSSSPSNSASSAVIGSTRTAPPDGPVKTSSSNTPAAGSSIPTIDPNAVSTKPRPSSEMVIGESRAAPTEKPVDPAAPVTSATVVPKATAVAPENAEQTTPNKPITYAPAEEQFKDLIDKARQSGFSEKALQTGIEAYNKGYFTKSGEFEAWINKFLNPKDAVTTAVDSTVGENKNTADTPVTTQTAVDLAEKELRAGLTEYEAKMANVTNTYKESQEALVTSAEQRYNAQTKNLNDALALQQELAAQQKALISSSSAIQKEELKIAYETNLAAVELQKKKVAEAYESMKEEQALLNTQRKVREETAMGLIYGGFGSTAANKNLEETIIRGERELMSLSKEAVDKDTEFQNQVVDLNKTYSLDSRKIDQWKAEQNSEIYSKLSSYVQQITADKNMAAVEKDAAIREAVTQYNTKVAEISATVAETRMNLSLEMLSRADRLKQQQFTNQMALAEETRAQNSYEYEQKRTVVNDARADLDLVLTSYVDKDYSTLPPEVLAQIRDLEQKAGLPSGAGQSIMEAAKADELKQGEIVKEFTNSITGEVTAVRYNFDTGKVETMRLGAFEGGDSVWTELGTDADGNVITLNEVTGEVRTQGRYSGASGPAESALSIPDGSYGGQCGHFVNQYTGIGVGDTYQSKLDKMDPSITKPEAGMVFVMPYSWTGHIGFILDVSTDGKIATVKDSNYYSTSDPEVVRTHTIPVSQMTGFLDISGSSRSANETEGTPVEEQTEETSLEDGSPSYESIY